MQNHPRGEHTKHLWVSTMAYVHRNERETHYFKGDQ